MGMGLLCLLALCYTTPWDSYLIREGIWTYKAQNIIGTVFFIPYEEYFFFVAQTITGCFMTAWLLTRFRKQRKHGLKITLTQMAFAGCTWLVAACLSVWAPWPPSMRYLMLVLVWSLPVLSLQWSVGYSVLFKEWKVWMFSTTILTFFFWGADSFAISQDIWSFPESTISGIQLLGVLPLEEALFFLATNLMVVQGYLLFTQVDLNKVKFSFTSWSNLNG